MCVYYTDLYKQLVAFYWWVIVADIKNHNENRLSRKLAKLLEQNKGQALFSILFSKSSIKDEYTSLENMDNSRLEYHVDKALKD